MSIKLLVKYLSIKLT